MYSVYSIEYIPVKYEYSKNSSYPFMKYKT